MICSIKTYTLTITYCFHDQPLCVCVLENFTDSAVMFILNSDADVHDVLADAAELPVNPPITQSKCCIV